MEQRVQFLTALLHAAGYAGWCLLFDEVELIGRYTPLRRALAYAWLAIWLGLEGARAWPGIVAAYAITDDFVTAVIEEREDKNRLARAVEAEGAAPRGTAGGPRDGAYRTDRACPSPAGAGGRRTGPRQSAS